ncbi:hypothetical protein [Oribacterium sp. P6A1]|uniref:hypothetical protein n=1 Tax=Oribacterium sp. P6A1 TaxID=1410612 RepID=UPI00056D8C68|nr:hypothetical protein [Oribacterium sp. P6A1]
MNKKILQAAVMIAALTISNPLPLYAYTVAGQGVTPISSVGGAVSYTYDSVPGSSMSAYGIEASELTLQQIEDSKGAWAWIDTDYDGVAERYYLIKSNVYLINGIMPDGKTVNSLGQWTVDGMVMHRMADDRNAVNAAIQRAQAEYGNSFNGIYSGLITTTEVKNTGKVATKTGTKDVTKKVTVQKYLTMTVSQKSVTELSVTVSDDDGAETLDYEYAGLNTLHNGVTMWKSKKSKNDEYLLFYGYNSIVFYDYDGNLAGQLMKIG